MHKQHLTCMEHSPSHTQRRSRKSKLHGVPTKDAYLGLHALDHLASVHIKELPLVCPLWSSNDMLDDVLHGVEGTLGGLATVGLPHFLDSPAHAGEPLPSALHGPPSSSQRPARPSPLLQPSHSQHILLRPPSCPKSPGPCPSSP